MNSSQKQLTKIFVFLFLFSFFVVNWNDVSWVFNYKALEGLAYDFFNPYQESPLLASADAKQLPATQIPVVGVKPVNEQVYPYSDKSNSLEIPSLGLVTPMLIGESTSNTVLEKQLNLGVVQYPGSVLPGQNGQIVVLGHSAPPNWPHIKHDWVFSNINNLNVGDSIILYFNNREYTYKVKSKNIIAAGQELNSAGASNSNILTIVSCWPPGKNYKRIAIDAELVKN